MARYSVIDKSLAELLADLDSDAIQGSVGAGSFELAHIAALIKVAQANEAAAERNARAVEAQADAARAQAAAAKSQADSADRTAHWARVAAGRQW